MQEGRKNLEKVDYCVDYVITNCASSEAQNLIVGILYSRGSISYHNVPDRLTNYFSWLEQRLQYNHWYFGHYHFNENLDSKHTVLYEAVQLL